MIVPYNLKENYSVVCQMLSSVMRKHVRSTRPPDYLRSIIDS